MVDKLTVKTPIEDEDSNLFLEEAKKAINFLVDAINSLLTRVSALEDISMNKDFFFEVASGKIEGMFGINVSGHSAGVSGTIGTVGNYDFALQTYSADGVADIDSISSSNVLDAHNMTIIGFDINGNIVKQTVALNGQTRVAITPVNRIQFTYHAQDSSDVTLGEIFVFVNTALSGGIPVDTTKIRSYIPLTNSISNEISASSVKTIPAGKWGMIVFGKTTVTDNKALELTFWGRPYGGVFKQSHHIDIKNNNYDYFFKLPQLIPPRTDLEVRATADSINTEVAVHYDVIIIDESLIGSSLNPLFS